MFASRAHSVSQQARLAITLAWVAGYTNIITLLTCATATSHISGTASQLGRHGAEGDWGPLGFTLWLLGTFALGAGLSAVFTHLGRALRWSSIYVLPVAFEGLLLAALFGGVFNHEPGAIETGWPLYAMTGLASVAMGLQNATVTDISSGVVRTTHVTGVLTDLGHEAVQLLIRWWSGQRAPDTKDAALVPGSFRRVLLLLSIVLSFSVGAALGTLAYDHLPAWSMVPPVLFLGWIIFVDLRTPIADIASETSTLHPALQGFELPRTVALYSLRLSAPRRGAKAHRLPNLLEWSDGLSPLARAVVLDLGEIADLDTNAALELSAVVARMRAEGRWLIVCGIAAPEFFRLCADIPGSALDAATLCPDLELAVARALSLVAFDGRSQSPRP